MIPLSDSQPAGKFPFWVVIIIAINIYFFYLELTSPGLDSFISQYALIPALIDFNILKTLNPFITSQFLHGGFLHIISNMLFYWLATQIFSGAFSLTTSMPDVGGVAFFAHIGGFITGWLMSKLISPRNILKPVD